MNYREGIAKKDGVEIMYRDYGAETSRPILMVHGLGAQLVHWAPHLIEFLISNNYRPITFDNRDSGYQQDLKKSHHCLWAIFAIS